MKIEQKLSPGRRDLSSAVAILGMVAMVVSVAPAQGAPQRWYSTHDHTAPGHEVMFKEFGADAKSPGDGFVYTVSTIEVNDTQNNPQYSGVGVQTGGAVTFALAPGFKRQVAIVQVTRASQTSVLDLQNQGIVAQWYFNGFTPPDSSQT